MTTPTGGGQAKGLAAVGLATTMILVLCTGAAAQNQAMESVTVSDIRGMRYCEVLLVFEDRVVIYNTTANDGCPEAKWQEMDTDSLAAEFGAATVQLNGPKFWAMDAQTLELGETETFGGIGARYAATLPIAALGAGEGADPYVGFTSSKKQTMVFEAGKPMYELVDADGNLYVLNAYGAQVQEGDPANLVDQLSPDPGWSFRVSTPPEDVVVEASTEVPVQMVGDDLRQYYTLFDTMTE